MSNEWSSGYVSEINYTYGFYRELTPNLLQLAAVTKGQLSPDMSAPAAYCELGCGQGLSTNILAAANPHIQFYANDFNPSQIAGAQALAAEAGTTNVHFLDSSFAQMLERTDLPDFDVIALHGIYSWISRENRKAIVDFIASKLKVGGIVYISYNTMPGWAPIMPLRRLFVDHAATGNGPILARIEAALKAAEALIDVNARYFMNVPAAKDRLKSINGQPRPYLAHEYFNRDWTPFYHGEVVDELASAKLSWIASANIVDSIEGFCFTQEQLKLLSDAAIGTRREELKDFIVNQQFRRDIFAKGALPLGSRRQEEYWSNTRFVGIVPRADSPLKIATSLGELSLSAEVYGPIADVISKGPIRGIDLIKALPSHNLAQICQALAVLTAYSACHPCSLEKNVQAALPGTQRFNNAVMEHARFSSDLNFLASPVTGGGLPMDRISLLMLAAHQSGQDIVAGTWKQLKSLNQRFVKDGRTLETEDENLAEMKVRADSFVEKTLPLLRNLQIA